MILRAHGLGAALLRPVTLIAIVAATVPFAFAWFTQHVWEDYYITLRSSRNLVEGNGLVFQPGERVHTFTSPLGVLLPALCTWISGGAETAALWLFRVFNITLLSAVAVILWNRVTALGLGRVGRFTLFGLLLLDAKLTDFSINGMETAMMVFFTLVLWCELERPSGPRVGWLAGLYSGLMWTRPDAFVIAGAITLAVFIWPTSLERSAHRPRILRGILMGGLIYAPWFMWAWWYYGSPVPHTIIAKSGITPIGDITHYLLIPFRALTSQTIADYLFMPANFTFGGWPRDLRNFEHLLAVIAAFSWLVPGIPRPGRRASFAVFVGVFYLCAIMLFAWYVPPWTALACIAVAFAADSFYMKCVSLGRTAAAAAVRICVVLAVAVQASVLLAVTQQVRVQQRIVEKQGRRAIGEWLRANASVNDTVFLEPLGYIGYFSNLKTYDFPGLSSPESVSAIRAGASRYVDVVNVLQPTWLVLRPQEIAAEGFSSTNEIPGYQAVHFRDGLPELDAIQILPGRPWLEFDSQFIVFKRLP